MPQRTTKVSLHSRLGCATERLSGQGPNFWEFGIGEEKWGEEMLHRLFRWDLLQGLMALGSMRPIALSIHVVMGAMFAAALGAHNNSEYSQLEDR